MLVQRVPDGRASDAQAGIYTRAIGMSAGLLPAAAPIEAAVPVTNTFGSPPGGEVATTGLTFLFSRAGSDGVIAAARRVAADLDARDGYVGVTGGDPGRDRPR